MREEVDYDGVVWCFKTSTGLFVTRRNGKIALQGNTAETADYVFSKRVIKPHMIRMCGTLNAYLVPRYGDNRYISFIDPVPEDKAFRNTEMTTSVGGQPVLTVNEARDEFMGLGPVPGGDTLMHPSLMVPVGDAEPGDDVSQKPDDDANAKHVRKEMKANQTKTANGVRVGYRVARTKLKVLAEKRQEQRDSLTAKIKADLEERLNAPSKKFATTKEQDETRWKEFSEYTEAAEKDVADTLRHLNGEQKAEVLANLPNAIKKGINPADLFNSEQWIGITTSAITPIMETLFDHQARSAAAEVGKPELNPFNDTTRAAVKRSVQLMSESYTQTTLEALETKIGEGLNAGESLADITKRVEEIYEWSDEKRAATVAKTESFRTANGALKEAWQQSGVVKTVKWWTANNPCPFCQKMNGTVIPIDDVFFKAGESLTATDDNGGERTMTMNYGDVPFPPIHPNCMCYLRPDSISI